MKIAPFTCLLFTLSACAGSAALPEQPTNEDGLRKAGLSPTIQRFAAQASERLTDLVDRERVARMLKTLTARPHHAGTPADLRTANLIHGAFTAAGLESRIDEYEVLLPYPQDLVVELLRPVAFRADLKEEAFDADFDTHSPAAIAPFLAYSVDGDVVAPLVYVNFARTSDFAKLKALGVSCTEAIGITRSGAISDASKAYNAANAGMAGLLVFPDPSEYGYRRGDAYPAGPWLPESGVRRGSLLDISVHPGDPLTPGAPALPRTHRLDVDAARSLPRIPAASISATDARPFLEQMSGLAVPQTWQGGLPFTYHLGNDRKVLVHLTVRSDWRLRKIWNVVATLRGSAFPDDWVLIGAHRDSWVHGAVEAASGTAVLVESARTLGALARNGLRPSRSIVFCSWDAAEYGLLGSTEFVEANRKVLLQSAILYVDLDAAVSGGRLRFRGDPSLTTLLQGTLAALRDSSAQGRSLLPHFPEQKLRPAGGGSDFTPFLHHLGVPVLTANSEGPHGVAHSRYDTYGWMKKYGDPDHRHHERLTRIVANLAWRCATASMVPFDFAALGTWARNTLHRLDSLPVDEDSEALGAALDAFDQAATDFAGARRDLLDRDPDPSAVNRLDLGARRVFRRFLRNAETAGEGFFKNMLLAPDAQTSTDVMPLPFLTTALETADAEATSQALKELTIAFKESADLLSYVTTRLRRE